MFAIKTGLWQANENFRNVGHLTVNLQAGPGDIDSLSDINAVSDFVNFLKSMAGQLKYLHLDGVCKDDQKYTNSDLDSIFEVMKANVFFPCIENLVLCEIVTAYASFISYLAKHRNTLQKYKVQSISVKDTDTELTGEDFHKKVLEDLTAAGLPGPESGWYMRNGDIPP
jgi:hypothetical protein